MADVLLIGCPYCSRELKIRDRNMLGRKAKCPGCGMQFVLKEPEPTPDEVEFSEAPAEDLPPPKPRAIKQLASVPDSGPSAEIREKPLRSATESNDLPKTGNLHKGKSPARKSNDGSVAISFEIPDEPDSHANSNFPGLKIDPPKPKVAPSPKPTVATAKRKKRSKIGPILLGVGMVTVFTGAVAVGAYLLNQAPAAKPMDINKPKVVFENQPPQKRLERPEFQPPVKSVPISLKMLPSGCQFVIHLRPAELWKAGGKTEDVRLCLGPLGKLVEQQLKGMCQFEPAQIEECTIVILAGARGTTPETAIAVHLLEPFKMSQILDRYGGSRNENWGYPVYESDKFSLVLGGDMKSFGIAPKGYGEALARSMTEANFTTRGIDGLLPHTDHARLVTLLFDTTDARIQAEQLFSKEARPLVDRFLDFLGDDVETVCWMFHQDEERFFSDLLVRNATKVAPARLEREMKHRLSEVPKQLLASVQLMHPKTMGRRQIIGRVPALTKAFAMATESTTGPRHVEFITPLPAKAGPNLAAGMLLAWDESLHTDFNRKPTTTPGTPGTPASSGGATIAEKMKSLIDVDFRRQPLQEAFAYVADEAKFTLDIDGDALKFSGYTKNMPQSFKYERIPAEKVLAKILQPYDKMCIVIDETKKVMTVMTYPVAEQRGLKPHKFPAPPE